VIATLLSAQVSDPGGRARPLGELAGERALLVFLREFG
jgi:hypothetical protein